MFCLFSAKVELDQQKVFSEKVREVEVSSSVSLALLPSQLSTFTVRPSHLSLQLFLS